MPLAILAQLSSRSLIPSVSSSPFRIGQTPTIGVGWPEELWPGSLSPQPAESALKPGIAVNYYYNFVRHIDELRRWMEYKDGIPEDSRASLDGYGWLGERMSDEEAA